MDFGGYYYFKNPGFQLLFAYGHSIAGQTERYAYLGLYETWGSKPGHGLNGFLSATSDRAERPEIPLIPAITRIEDAGLPPAAKSQEIGLS